MTITLTLLALFLAAVVYCLRLPLRLTMHLCIGDGPPRLSIQLRYGKRSGRERTWILPRKTSPGPKNAKVPHVEPEMVGHALWALTVLGRVNHYLWERCHILQFELDARVGFNNAATTAVWLGRTIEVVAWWISLRVAPRSVSAPHYMIVPVWDSSEVYCNFTSIIEVLPSDIILAMVYGLLGRDKGGHARYGKSIQQHA